MRRSATGTHAIEQLQKWPSCGEHRLGRPSHLEEVGAARRLDDRPFERVVFSRAFVAAHGHLPGIEGTALDLDRVLTEPVGFAIGALYVIRRDVRELFDPTIDVGVNRPALPGPEVEHG